IIPHSYIIFLYRHCYPQPPHSFPTRRSSDLAERNAFVQGACLGNPQLQAEVQVLLRAHQESGDLLDAPEAIMPTIDQPTERIGRSEEHTSELQSPDHLVCRLLLEKKKQNIHK